MNTEFTFLDYLKRAHEVAPITDNIEGWNIESMIIANKFYFKVTNESGHHTKKVLVEGFDEISYIGYRIPSYVMFYIASKVDDYHSYYKGIKIEKYL
jgi:hypothetical protein